MLATYLISYCGRACSYSCVAAQGYCWLSNSLLHIEQKSESKILPPFCYSYTKYHGQKFTFSVVYGLKIILLCCASSMRKLCCAIAFTMDNAIFIGNFEMELYSCQLIAFSVVCGWCDLIPELLCTSNYNYNKITKHSCDLPHSNYASDIAAAPVA